MAYQKMLDSTFEKYYVRFRKLRAVSAENAVSREELFIAMALLPIGTDVGSKLRYEMLEYTLVG